MFAIFLFVYILIFLLPHSTITDFVSQPVSFVLVFFFFFLSHPPLMRMCDEGGGTACYRFLCAPATRPLNAAALMSYESLTFLLVVVAVGFV